MATIKTDAAYMGFPLSIKRGNPAPVDTTAVWYDKTKLETYAVSDPVAYVGQIVTLYVENKCEAYMISNEAGTLIKLASTTASGDLASDVAALQSQVSDLITKVGKAAAGEEAATGLYKDIADILAVANAKVASIGATDASVVVDSSTAVTPKIQVQISKDEDNALSLATDGLKVIVPDVIHPEYTIVEDKTNDAYSAVYHLTKDGENVGAAINIPKDMVVKSGSVEVNPTGQTAGTYLVLVLANATEDKIYINVGDLIEYVTAGESPDGMVVVSISDDHKVTATLGNASITEAKLAKAVTAKLAKAVSAVQSVAAGSANGTIAVDGEDVAVTGLKSAAFTESSAYDAAGDADAVKTALIGGTDDNDAALSIYGAKAYAKAMSESAKADAVNDAKAHVTTELGKLKVEDTAVEKQFVDYVTQANGKITPHHRALAADDVPELGISKISGLQTALNAKQDEVTFNTAYDAATNKAATMSDIGTAKSELVGTTEDASSVDTVKGTKKYADEKASAAESAAKAYADGLVAGDSGITKRVDALEAKHATGKTVAEEVTDGINALKLSENYAAKDTTDAHIANTDIHVTAAKKTAWDKVVSDVETLNGTEATEGSIKQIAKSYADGKDNAIAEAKKAGTDAAAAVTALDTKVGNLPEGVTSTTVVSYVDEKIGKIPTQTDYTVTVTPSEVTGVAKRYTIAQASTGLNVNIDIPKDMVVSSGTVETNPTGQPAGTYLVLTLANATNDKVYIDVGSLIEYVTAGDSPDGMVEVAVSAGHKVTATIVDGSITKTKLATAVQNSLDKADSAIQKAGLDVALEDYVTKNGTDRLMTVDEGTKLQGIETSAQVNKIETVKVDGTALAINDKAVDITEISTDLLVQGDDVLILNGGTASDV